jgi:hypothetical protein
VLHVVDSSAEPTASSELRYGKHLPHSFLRSWCTCAIVVYYIVYTENGARQSKQPVNPDNPYLARIWAKQVTPPHTVASLKRCICGIEGIPRALIRGQLFSDILSESPMNEGAFPSLQAMDPALSWESQWPSSYPPST